MISPGGGAVTGTAPATGCRSAVPHSAHQIGGERGERVDGAGGQRRVQALVELDGVEAARRSDAVPQRYGRSC
jgi:hypothetical protein